MMLYKVYHFKYLKLLKESYVCFSLIHQVFILLAFGKICFQFSIHHITIKADHRRNLQKLYSNALLLMQNTKARSVVYRVLCYQMESPKIIVSDLNNV